MRAENRLKKRAAFAYVYKKGEKTGVHGLLLISAKSREGLKIGLSVSKKTGNAVTRNRIKRLLREGVQTLIQDIDPRFLYVIVASPSLADLGYAQVLEELRKAFSKAGKLKAEESGI